jgi:hypothetical protein
MLLKGLSDIVRIYFIRLFTPHNFTNLSQTKNCLDISGFGAIAPIQRPLLSHNNNFELRRNINRPFDLDKSGQKFHYSLKEHRKISNILKFRCKML